MKEGKVGMLALLHVVVLMLVLCVSSSSSSLSSASYFDQKQNRRKSMVPTQRTSSLKLNRVGSSIVLPVDGNVYPIGFYNVTLNIGQPSKPYFVDPDTGSNLTWLQCDAPWAQFSVTPHAHYEPSSENKVPCKDPLCQSLHPPGEHRCETPEQCDYELQYLDGLLSYGVLVKDVFSFNSISGEQFIPSLALGCGYNQTPGFFSHPSDGILGLGKGESSFLSQLSSQELVKNVVGHCLSVRGGGYFFLGDDLYDSSHVIWTSMSLDHPEHYSPGYAELKYGEKSTGIENLLTVFDSGSTYTYLISSAYQAFISLVMEELTGSSLSEALDDHTLTLCWKGEKPFKSLQDVKTYFKPFALSFTNGGKAKAKFEMPLEAYLIISHKGNVCLGILDGGKIDVNIIGDISMQDKLVIYNNEEQLIGWMNEKNCDLLPKSKTTSIW
ncbi:aspartic proteinase Asp1-like [Fagus crenata]